MASVDPLSRRSSTVYDKAGRSVASINPLNQRTTTVYDVVGQSVGSIDPLSRRSSTVYDQAGRSVASINPLNQRTTTVYDAAGESIASVDPLNRRSSTVYDLAGRSVASINPLNQRTTTVYDAAGESIASVDPLSRRSSTIFDLAGRSVASINALAQRTTTVYDSAGQSVANIDPLSRRTSTVYDKAGRSIASLNGLGQRTTTVYDAAGESIASVDPLNRRSSTVYDLAGRSVASVNPLSQRTTTVYDAAGESIASIDPLARRNSTVYDLAGRSVASINPLGFRTSTIYDSAGESVVSIDPLGRRSSTVYDRAGRSVASINPLNQRTTTVYDAAGQSVASIDPLNQRSSTIYDLAGESVAEINPLGFRTTTVYDAAGQSVGNIDPLSRRTSTVYDRAGRSVASINGLGKRATTVYDSAGQSIASVDPLSRRSSTVYDKAGRSVASINPLSQRTSTVYDAAGQSIANVDPLVRRNSTVYDLAGRSLARVNPLNQRTSTVYDRAGQSIANIDPLSRRTSTLYDLAGRSVANINALGFRTTTVYDIAGESVVSIDPLARRSSSVYDLAGRTVASLNPLAQRTTTVYDAAGKRIASINPLSQRTTSVYDRAGRSVASVNALSQRTSTVYDAAGQTTATVNALGYRTSYAFDLAARKIRMTDARSYSTSFVYDVAGQEVARVDPLLRRTTASYDLAGRKVLTWDARGVRVTSVFDAAGQQTSEQQPSNIRVTFAYDLASRRTLVNDVTGRTTTVYDTAGQTTVVAQPMNKRVSYSFDLAGRRSLLRDPDSGRTTYSHDAAGQLVGLKSPQNGRTTFAYDLAGRESVKRLANGVRVTHAYDAAGRVAVLNTSGGSGSLRRLTYTMDAVGRRTVIAASDGSRTSYAYDPAGQLTHEQRARSGINVTHVYDAVGNRTLQIDSGTRSTFSYDAANQLLTEKTNTARTTFQYDAVGSRSRKDDPATTTYYTWDAKSRLSVAEQVAGRVSFTYDGMSRRATKQSAGETTRYVWDFKKVLQEADGSGTTEIQYLSSDKEYGNLVSGYGDGATKYYGFDALGSTEMLLDDSGSATARMEYRAYGLMVSEQPGMVLPAALPQRFGHSGVDTQTGEHSTFVGQQGYFHDTEINLYFLGMGGGQDLDGRGGVFDPFTARMLGEDPLEERSGQTNWYLYCGNDPVNKIDPSGNRIWYPIDRCGCNVKTISGYTLNPFQILQRELFFTYGNNSDWSDFGGTYFRNISSQNLNGYNYRAADSLLRDMPPKAWVKINNDNSYLADALKTSLSQDVWICGATKERASPNLDHGLTYDGFPYNYRIGLDWAQTPPTAWTWAYAATVFFEKVDGIAASIDDTVVKAATAALKAALGSLLSLIKPPIDPVHFFNNLTHFVSDISGSISDIVSDPEKFVQNFIDGIGGGLKQFAAEFPGNALGTVLDWFVEEVDPTARLKETEYPTDLEPETLAFFFLRIAGLSTDQFKAAAVQQGFPWTELVEAVQSVVGEVPLEKVLTDPDELADLFDGLWEEGDAAQDNPFDALGSKLFEEFFGDVKRELVAEVLTAGITTLASYAVGGLASLVRLLVKVGGIGAALLGKVSELLKTIGGGIAAAAKFTAKEVIPFVLAGLRKFIGLALSFFKKLFNLSLTKVAALFQKIKEKVRKIRDKLLAKLRGKKKPTTPEPCETGIAGQTPAGGQTPANPGAKPPPKGKCFGAGTQPKPIEGDRPNIEDHGSLLLRELVTWEPGEEGHVESVATPSAGIVEEASRVVWCVQEREDGSRSVAGLVRSLDWIEDEGIADVGDWLTLDLEEMGCAGEFQVVAIEPCPVRKRTGRGRLVTAWFHHTRARVFHVWVAGEPKPLVITGLHPVWSVDRKRWVSVGDWVLGERVRIEGGTANVWKIEEIGEEEVFNLEVDADHCYRVGEQGVLVHNASIPKMLTATMVGKNYGCGNLAGSGNADRDHSPNLATNIKGGVPAGYEGHHLIGVEFLDSQNKNFLPIMRWAVALGYDINRQNNGAAYPSYGDNYGLTLEDGQKESCKAKLPLHKGRHGADKSVACIKTYLVTLQNDYIAGRVKDCNLCASIKKIENKIRRQLKAHTIWLNSSDPWVTVTKPKQKCSPAMDKAEPC